MKYTLSALLIFVVVSLVFGTFSSAYMASRKDDPCKLSQRYYLKGKLVLERTADNGTITEHGCLNNYKAAGQDFYADSIVTTLK